MLGQPLGEAIILEGDAMGLFGDEIRLGEEGSYI